MPVKWDGTTLSARVDSGSWSPTSAGSINYLTPTMVSGRDYSGATFFDGNILEIMTSDEALSDADFDTLKSYVNTRYGLSL